MEPYIEGRVHMNWRWNYNMAAGQYMEWVAITVTSRTGARLRQQRALPEIEGTEIFRGGCAMEHLHQVSYELKYPDTSRLRCGRTR